MVRKPGAIALSDSTALFGEIVNQAVDCLTDVHKRTLGVLDAVNDIIRGGTKEYFT